MATLLLMNQMLRGKFRQPNGEAKQFNGRRTPMRRQHIGRLSAAGIRQNPPR